jgi:NTP pyrophosphatase (non-canonical NTP hydrolase)
MLRIMTRREFRRKIKSERAGVKHLITYAYHNNDIESVFGDGRSPEEIEQYIAELRLSDDFLTDVLKFSESPVLLVERWAEVFSLPIESKPVLLPERENDLAIKLIDEELAEVKKALAEDNLIEMADGFGDLFWVVVRAMQRAGVDVDKTISAIYDSNMSKLATSKEEAEQSVAKYAEQGVEAGYTKVGKKYYKIFRKSDNKVLKSVNFAVPNFKGLWD